MADNHHNHQDKHDQQREEQIAQQLRAYADALVAVGEPATNSGTASAISGGPGRNSVSPPGAVPDDRDEATHRGALPRRRRPLLAAAAVVVLALVGWSVWRSQPSTTTTESTSDDDLSTGPDSGMTEAVEEATGWPLADPTRWAAIAHYGPDLGEPEPHPPESPPGGVWAWRLEGTTYVLVTGYTEATGPLAEAQPVDETTRVTLGWVVDGQRLGLQAYDVDAATVRQTAESLLFDDGSWTLPGAEVLIDEPSVDPAGPTEQLDLAPVDADGIAGLAPTVTLVIRPESTGGMYRELFEASSIGSVTETTIAGQPGFVIEGPMASYALASGNGWVATWQSRDQGVDMAELVASIELVDEQRWQQVVDGVDRTAEEALQAAVEAQGEATDPGPDTSADPADLPRYLLPEPWKLAWVTDMGLWTEEQWAQRRALEEANTANYPDAPELVWTQGFRRRSVPSTTPLELPEVVVQVYRHTEPIDNDLDWFDFGERRVDVAGLEGRVAEVHAFGEGVVHAVFAAGGRYTIDLQGAALTEDETIAFARSLEPNDGDIGNGLRSTDSEFQLVVDVPGADGETFDPVRQWLSAYEPEGGPAVSVQRLDEQQFRLSLVEHGWVDAANWELADGGRFLFLAPPPEPADSPSTADEGHVINGPEGAEPPSTLVHYDRRTSIATTVSAAATVTELIELFDSLQEIDLDAWRELVEPYNSDPARPR